MSGVSSNEAECATSLQDVLKGRFPNIHQLTVHRTSRGPPVEGKERASIHLLLQSLQTKNHKAVISDVPGAVEQLWVWGVGWGVREPQGLITAVQFCQQHRPNSSCDMFQWVIICWLGFLWLSLTSREVQGVKVQRGEGMKL